MSFVASTKHCWYNDDRMIVKMYFLNNIPFTFDEMPDGHLYDRDFLKIKVMRLMMFIEDLSI